MPLQVLGKQRGTDQASTLAHSSLNTLPPSHRQAVRALAPSLATSLTMSSTRATFADRGCSPAPGIPLLCLATCTGNLSTGQDCQLQPESHHAYSCAGFDTPCPKAPSTALNQCPCLLINKHAGRGVPADRAVLSVRHWCRLDMGLTRCAGCRGPLWHRVRMAFAAPQDLDAVEVHVRWCCALHASTHAQVS